MWLNVHKRMSLGRAGLCFWDELPGRLAYRYWARGSGPWAVRVTKKSARAISTINSKIKQTRCEKVLTRAAYRVVACRVPANAP